MTFVGFAYSASDDSELDAAREAQDEALTESLAALGGVSGLLDVSLGTTPLARFESGMASEYRYGNYVFNDATQVALGSAAMGDCALAVITTVLDVPSDTRVVLDAGSKSLPAEMMSPRTRGFGILVDHPHLCLTKLFEEHGLAESERPHGLQVGDRLAIIPNHACTCVNLHDEYIVYDDGSPLDVWQVRARRIYRDRVPPD
jgi:D-serine deaminase-like pyridoxal phosphate-dependent protein